MRRTNLIVQRRCPEIRAPRQRRRPSSSPSRIEHPDDVAYSLGLADASCDLRPVEAERFDGYGGRRAYDTYRRGYEAGRKPS